MLVYVFLSTLGAMLGYYVVVWLVPGANFLNLNLPGLPPPAIEIEESGPNEQAARTVPPASRPITATVPDLRANPPRITPWPDSPSVLPADYLALQRF